MQTLFLTYRDGTTGMISVSDKVGINELTTLMVSRNLIDELDTGDNIQVAVAIRGADVRTAVLTAGGQVLAPGQATADDLDRADTEHEVVIASEPVPDYQEAGDKISDAYANIKTESQTKPPDRSRGVKPPTELELP